MQITRFLPLIAVAFILSSCVSQTKYNDLLGGKSRSDREVSWLTKAEKEPQSTMVELDEAYGDTYRT
ncbi:MAG TPA: hypothetical protein VI603_06435 [Saprospiraceae bacterium]|nr:hypothetical protein [Saprospiraceae bacterium]